MGESGTKHWLTPAILTLFVTSIALGSLEFSVIGIQTELAQFFGRNVADIGLLVTSFAIGMVIGTPVVMVLTAEMNRFRIMTASMLLLIALTALSVVMENYFVLLICRFVSAFLCGAIVSSSYVLSTDIPAPENRGKAMTLVFAGYSVSSVFIIPVIETLANHFSWQTSYLMVMVIQIISIVMMFLFLPREGSKWSGNRDDEINLFRDKRIILALVAPIFAVCAVYMVYSYITTIFVDGFGIMEKYLYVFLFVFGLMTIVSNVISAYVESHGGICALKTVFAIQAVVLVLVSVAIIWLNDDLWLVGVSIMMLIGVIMYILNTPIQSYYIRVAKEDYPGGVYLSSCFQSIAFNMGVALGSLFGGAIFHFGGMGNIGFAAAGITVIAIITMVALEKTIGVHKN